MSAQTIYIDPMVPHYNNRFGQDSGSKGGQSSRTTSVTVRENSPPNVIVERSQQAQDHVELKAVEDSDDRINIDPRDDEIRDAEKKGINQAITESVKEHRKNTFKFFGLLNKSEKLVLRVRNIIPVLHSEILVDTAKVTLIHRPFFFSERIHSISIKDISDVFIETAPFFGTVNIVDFNFTENVLRQKWFWKKDAEKARRIITGLMAASREQVDLKNIEDDSLAEKLESIGQLHDTRTSVSAA